jgi:hypothetical protein
MEHYGCWKFWSMATWATQILGATFFKHKYLSNLMPTPEDLVIAMGANLARALETTIPQQLGVSAIQASRIYQKYSQTQPKSTPMTLLRT